MSGIVNFKGDIGKSDFIINVNGRAHLAITIEVFPTKIDYNEDYEEILRDVNEEIYNLAYEFLKRTYLNTKISAMNSNSGTEFYSILKYLYDNLIRAINIILHNPHHELIGHEKIVKGHRLKNISKDTIKWLEKRPHKVMKREDTYIPIEGLQINKRVTIDTNENRFLRYIILDIIEKIETFIKRYSALQREADSQVISTLGSMKNKLRNMINSTFLKEVGEYNMNSSLSLVFTMGNGYREVYKYYLMLKKGLTIDSHIFTLSMKELSLLYEYWCFIKINSLLRKKYKLISSDMMKINRGGIFVTLQKGKTSCMTYENPITGERFTIAYNPKKTSKTISQKPDNILSINKEGSKVNYEFVFDAKYKIDTAENYIAAYGGIGPKEEDINTMHRYRDAIIYENGKNNYESNIYGAFVLFPYKDEEAYRNHRFYKSIEEVNVGALPFLPSTTNLMEEFLQELIGESPYSTIERALETSNMDQALKDEYFTNRNVLIGSLKNKEQLKINLDNKFYHTSASNVDLMNRKIDYIALAQSKNTFGEEGGISYYGKIKEIRTVKRREIVEISKDSDEEYYRFEIEEWVKLPKKILVDRYQVRKIIYTSKYLLFNSSTVRELTIKSVEEFRLWKELMRLQSSESKEGFFFRGKEILIQGENIRIVCGSYINEIPLKMVRECPKKVIGEIIR